MLASVLARYDASPSSLRPLLNSFWSSNGWNDPPQWPDAAEMSRAVERGVMFAETRTLDHDGWVQAVRDVATKVSPHEVEEGFLASLTSRRLDLRSALSSYMIARVLPDHDFQDSPGGECSICGLYEGADPEDLNVLNFERFKWGGVRRDDPTYVAFDLEQLLRAPRLPATDEDIALGRAILATLAGLPADVTAPQAAKHLTALPGNKSERDTVLDILGICSILQTARHPGYVNQFVPADNASCHPIATWSAPTQSAGGPRPTASTAMHSIKYSLDWHSRKGPASTSQHASTGTSAHAAIRRSMRSVRSMVGSLGHETAHRGLR